jgi:hypothetical protein
VTRRAGHWTAGPTADPTLGVPHPWAVVAVALPYVSHCHDGPTRGVLATCTQSFSRFHLRVGLVEKDGRGGLVGPASMTSRLRTEINCKCAGIRWHEGIVFHPRYFPSLSLVSVS